MESWTKSHARLPFAMAVGFDLRLGIVAAGHHQSSQPATHLRRFRDKHHSFVVAPGNSITLRTEGKSVGGDTTVGCEQKRWPVAGKVVQLPPGSRQAARSVSNSSGTKAPAVAHGCDGLAVA